MLEVRADVDVYIKVANGTTRRRAFTSTCEMIIQCNDDTMQFHGLQTFQREHCIIKHIVTVRVWYYSDCHGLVFHILLSNSLLNRAFLKIYRRSKKFDHSSNVVSSNVVSSNIV